MEVVHTPDLKQLSIVVQELDKRLKCPFYKIYPKEGALSWNKYPKHQEFLKATLGSNIVYFRAANRIGKTMLISWMLTAYLTGVYPEIWTGRKFDKPVKGWVVGVTHSRVKEVIQEMLVKEALAADDGGLIPSELIVHFTSKQKPSGAYLELYVRHVPTWLSYTESKRQEILKKGTTEGCSRVTFKCYEQGVDDFQGAKLDFILFDEEPPEDIWGECLVRMMSGKDDGRSGQILIAATPLKGMTNFVRSFLDDNNPNRKCIVASWDDVPHLSDREKAEMILEIEPHLLEARTKGMPYLGAGMVFPVSPDRYKEDPLPKILKHYKLINGLDDGHYTAAVFGAFDPITKVLHVYGEKMFTGIATPMKAYALAQISKAPYSTDTSVNTVNQRDQVAMSFEYTECGMNLVWPNKKLKESVIAKVYSMMLSGLLKISTDCKQLLACLMSYVRDMDGTIKKSQNPNDHFVDAFLYMVQRIDAAMSMSEIELDVSQRHAEQFFNNYQDEYSSKDNKSGDI